MYKFTNFEQDIIRKIIEIDKNASLNVIGNILENIFGLDNQYFIKIQSEDDIYLNIEPDYFNKNFISPDWIKHFLKNIENKLMQIIKLIDYLEKNKFLILIDDNLKLTTIGGEVEDINYKKFNNINSIIKKSLFKYSNCKFYPTNELYELYDNKFKTDEEIKYELEELRYDKEKKHNDNMFKATIAAIILSALSVLASIFVPICFTNDVMIKNKILEIKTNETKESIPIIIEKDKKLLIKILDDNTNDNK